MRTFQAPSFWPWHTVAKVISGEKLDKREAKLFRECTGRTKLPKGPVSNLTGHRRTRSANSGNRYLVAMLETRTGDGASATTGFACCLPGRTRSFSNGPLIGLTDC
jgi:hypothetical protein